MTGRAWHRKQEMEKKLREEKRLIFPEIEDYEKLYMEYPEEWFQKVLIEEEKKKPVEESWRTLMEELFFKGGKVPINQELPEEYRKKGLKILHRVISSWDPPHEHKETVVAHILRSLCT